MKEYHVIMTKRRMLERIEQYKCSVTKAAEEMLAKMKEVVSLSDDSEFFYLPKQFEEVIFHNTDEVVNFIYHNLAKGGNNRADSAVQLYNEEFKMFMFS